MNSRGKIGVLVVDDSAIVRKILQETLSEADDLEVVGTAPDPYVARDKILSLQPDVLTLDIEMPRMDGLTFLRKLMHFHPMPVVVVSSLTQASCQTALEAFQLGAVEVLAKPGGPYSAGELRRLLPEKIRSAAIARLKTSRSAAEAPAAPVRLRAASFPADSLIAIGASTGGIEAVETILTALPPATPGILITQHIPPVFSRSFAERLDRLSKIRVKEAADGDPVAPGCALIAPGNLHMTVSRDGKGYRVQIKDGPRVCYQRPSVDVLFQSVAKAAGPLATGVLLTGMGSDGARGLLAMRKAGAATIAQDEATSAVFGMPREATRMGAVEQVTPLPEIAAAMMEKAARRTAQTLVH